MVATKEVEGDGTERRLSALERRERLSQVLARASYVSIADMAQHFKVSEMTIRRDLDALARQGLAERAHGGAVVQGTSRAMRLDVIEPALDVRLRENSDAKTRIGRAAARLIAPHQTIAVDIGSTTFSLAQTIQEMDVQVFTNSVKIGLMLASAAPRVYMPGGEIRGTEPSLVGDMARRQLENFRFDWLFLGASGIAPTGLYDYSLDDSEIKRALIGSAARVVALLDGSKFDRLSVVRICSLDDIDVLITDRLPDGALAQALAAVGIELTIAE